MISWIRQPQVVDRWDWGWSPPELALKVLFEISYVYHIAPGGLQRAERYR